MTWAAAESSKPTTPASVPVRIERSSNARSTPIAIVSLAQTKPVAPASICVVRGHPGGVDVVRDPLRQAVGVELGVEHGGGPPGAAVLADP